MAFIWWYCKVKRNRYGDHASIHREIISVSIEITQKLHYNVHNIIVTNPAARHTYIHLEVVLFMSGQLTF